MKAALLDLGTVEYGKAWEMQRALVEGRARDEVPDTLVLLEHPHVVTLGRKTSPENMNPKGVPVYTVERGGDATYHGPGQLVGYPIMKLRDHDVRRHVRMTEAALLAAVKRFGVDGRRRDDHPGVWVGERKLASIGVAVTNWVAYHGFALNVNTEMRGFELIRPCGLDPSRMTSMESLLGARQEMGAVRAAVAEEFAAAAGLEFQLTELSSLSPPANIK